MQENNRRIAKNTMFLYIRMIVVLFVSLYTTRVVLNALGVVDYGIYNVVAGFVSMFAFLNTSMSNGVQRFYNYKLGKEGEPALTKVYNVSLLIQLILSALVIILLETIGLWYLNEKMVIPSERIVAAHWIYQFSIASMLFVIVQVPYVAAIMAHERMNYFACVSIIDVSLKLVGAFILSHVSIDKLIVYGGYSLGIAFLDFLIYYIYCKQNFNALKRWRRLDMTLFRDMLSFSGWNLLETFAYMLKNQGINILLNIFWGPVVNAARGISLMISNAIQGFQSNIVIAFRPQTVQSYADGNLTRVKNLMYSLSKLSYIMLFMLSMPVMIELPYILKIWLGNVIPDHTISFTVLILLIMTISALNTPLSQVVHATGNIKKYQICASIVIGLIFPLSWAALKFGGNPESVYIVSMVMVIVNQILCLILLKEIFPYKILEYFKKVIWPCLMVTIGAILIPVIIHYSFRPSFLRVVIVAITGICGTIVISYFYVLDKSEKDLVKIFISKLFKKINTRKSID